MNILNGKEVSNHLKAKLKNEILEYKEKYNTKPRMVIIQVGNDNASSIYIKNKIKACEEVGIKTNYNHLSEDTSESELIELIEFYNNKENIEGIIVQTPLPSHIQYKSIIKVIDPKKDVDGFHSDNMGRTALGLPGIKPATALGVKLLLEHYNIDWKGKDIVVVGRGLHVGLPIAIMLGDDDMGTVTSCHKNTKNLKEKTLNADIIISAVGKEKLITEDMVKEGVIIVDVGINRNKEGKICGDVDFEKVKNKASYISPVPGGVGPMTVVSLLYNTFWAYKNRYE
jgi:methylenetetrahydrofolate dehydrogenase (NADP+)/methenyltetrahydrofolate cyclohydrolase